MNFEPGKREWTREELDGLREAVQGVMAKTRWGQAEVARQSTVAPATLSQFLNDRYGGDNSAVALKLSRWLDQHNAAVSLRQMVPPEPTFVQTTTADKVQGVLQWAQMLNDLGVIVGPPGIGKTAAADQYAAHGGMRVYKIACAPSISTPSAVLAAFITKYAPANGRMERSLMARSAFVRQMLTKGALLILDEAQHASVAVLEELRAIHDDTKCGLVVMGNELVLTRIQGARRDPAYAQIFGRVGNRVTLTKKDLEKDVPPVLATMGVDAKEVIDVALDIVRREDIRVVVKVTRSALLMANGASENLAPKHMRAAYRRLTGSEAA